MTNSQLIGLNIYTLLYLLLKTDYSLCFIGFAGPACTVTSLIPGTPSATTSSMMGTCYSSISCRSLGGVAIGKCGVSNVCCVFPRTCDAVSSMNSTYFTNPAYPSPYNGSTICTLTMNRAASLYKICQLRLDFVDFEINRPIGGNCDVDKFMVSGQNSNSLVPPICGRNSGTHVYMDVDGAQGPFTFRVITNGPGYRRWNIQITQIECTNPSKAPSNCLQYYTGPSGMFSSFNYETSQFQDFSSTNPQSGQSGQLFLDATYLNGMDYAICFRKENGFCTQSYSVNSTFTPFEIVNFGPNNSPTFDQSVAGAGLTRCAYDYIQLNGVRFCGSRLNIRGVDQSPNQDAPVIDTGAGPFIARFVSDSRNVGRGFKLSFQQNPCGIKFDQMSTQRGG
ncbi:uncharacterized protein LOC128396407 [Panonychus citri]|uniref:uncharacterized protein LOC128396407 n=1 Tax=Panonychus citri TaxID=50023 RepID=UPI002307D282|nr:uncharacterized protein LOC128396407 [Panonychus citri]